MSTDDRFPEKLKRAFGKAELAVQKAFREIIEGVGEHCPHHKGRDKPDYRFYSRPQYKSQFCGIVPQEHLIKVGLANQEARVPSRILKMKRVRSDPKWEECWVDPADPAHVPEAIRIIVEVSRALGGPDGPHIPSERHAPSVPPGTLRGSTLTGSGNPDLTGPAGSGTEAAHSREAKRAALIQALRNIGPEMRAKLEERKRAGCKDLDRHDWVWNALLGSFPTMGSSRGYDGLIANRSNYNRVTFEALSALTPADRLERLETVLLAAKVRMPRQKAKWLHANYEMIVQMGGLEEARRLALAQVGTRAKFAFLTRFHGIRDKYGRNIWMDCYHPDFRETIAIDERIKQVTRALGYAPDAFGYAEHERFYQAIAREAGLQGWELDRLLYHFKDELLAKLSQG